MALLEELFAVISREDDDRLIAPGEVFEEISEKRIDVVN